ncbi:MAG: hypothetical protein GC201_15145 [Alphaproteobacteria bacterium]|nr:hypothetical protein [Alphaproteobacteria bacterium]
MAEPCAKRNPLVRSGMTQDGRRRAELATDYFLPDERGLADLVLFGQRFARHIQYYDAGNAKAGDWSAFFESDVTASLAALARLPVDAFRSFLLDLETWLKADPARDPGQLAAHAKLGFHLPVVLLQVAGARHERLPGNHPFVPVMIDLAARDLADPLTGLIAWYKGAVDVGVPNKSIFDDTPLAMADYNVDGAPGDTRVRLSSTIASAIAGQPRFSQAPVPDLLLSQIPPGTWADLYAATAADPSPYLDAIGSANERYEQIYDALTYNLLSTAVERIFQALERIRRDAADYLDASLRDFAEHTPHYGLWLAFLQLFEHAQGEMNAFTGRHLDFYFREVLRLDNRAATPDKVHLLFELAKGQTAHLLGAGTLFRAGKDALGRPLSYALENDTVVNRASVAELRGLQVVAGGTPSAPTQTPLAALAVRSRDGFGEVELAKDDPTWPPFGPTASPAARVGFAVADRKLFLREGARVVTIRAELKSAVTASGVSPRWVVRLSGDKGWFVLSGTAKIKTVIDNSYTEPPEDGEEEAPSRGRQQAGAQKAIAGRKNAKPGRASGKGDSFIDFFASEKQAGGRAGSGAREEARGGKDSGKRPVKPIHIMEITVSLDAEDPPVIPVDAKLHGTDYEPGVPVIEVAFDFTAAAASRAFAVLRDARTNRVTLKTEASGLKNLMVVAGGGVADAAKPFAPFGAQPRSGAPLVIGSSEIFSKSIADFGLTVDWETPYTSTGFFWTRSADSYNAAEAVLSGGKWLTVASGRTAKSRYGRARPKRTGTDIALGETDAEVPMRGASLIDGLAEQSIDNPALDVTAVNGFVRLKLPYDFGHAAYVVENTRALIGMSGGTAYAPRSGINTYTPASGSGQLPREPYNPVITRIEAAYETSRDPVQGFALLHPFGLSDGTADRRLFPAFPFEGALLVGVKDFGPPARLTLLVQVADGTGDPLKHAPDLQFAYLDGDSWTAFEPQDVDDKTGDFSGSGVLGLNVPEQADTAHGILPDGLHWIRISAAKDSDALNRLLSVDAQAARAAFVDAGNDPAFLETPLPAGTISKLVVPDLAIKKIVQPYSSFDGRPRETSDAFAVRVSERLRHKDRAVTMWDYEALVLEAFPRLYRVKCLGTTELRRNAQNVIVADDELMPGAVTVVTVPWTHGQNTRDPLRPYTDQATLTAVDAFLRKRVSPFVRLEVQNPKFEEVQVDFKVRFRPGIGDIAFYKDELNKAVIGFLTPWAQPGGGDITFGGKLWKSSIIDFVEERPEVDYVTDFRLFHKIDVDATPGAWSPVDVEVIETTTARSILVSAARHTINEVPGNA